MENNNIVIYQNDELPLTEGGQLQFDDASNSLAARFLEENSYQSDFHQFRFAKINQPTINWGYFSSKKDADNLELIPGHVFFDENNQPVTHQILALRGMLIKMSFGFALYDGVEKKQVCRTIGMSEFLNGKEIHTKSVLPLPMPVRAPFRSAEKRNEYAPALKKRALTLYGSRSAITLEDGEETTRTCQLCVEKGEHIIEHGDGKKSTCGLMGEMIMVVFEVACQVTDPKNPRAINLRWVKPEQLAVPSLTRPFTLRIAIPASTALNKIGTDTYDIAIKPRAYLPEKLYSVQEYLNWIGGQGRHTWRPLRGGGIGFMQPIEVYSVERISDNGGYIPVLANHGTPDQDLLTKAWQIYQLEKNTPRDETQEQAPMLSPAASTVNSEIPDIFAVK